VIRRLVRDGLARDRLSSCHRLLSTRSDGEYLALLEAKLPVLYEEALHQFAPAWLATANVVGAASLSPPSHVLDLASGASAEPAITLAQRFTGATVVASDNNPSILQLAASRVDELGLNERVELAAIDLANLVELGRAGGDTAGEDDQIADVVTCSLGLFMLPPAHQEPCLRGIHALLRPGGLMVATVWDRMALTEVGGRCMAKVLGKAEPPAMPYDSTCLGHGRADVMLRAAGYTLLDEAVAGGQPHHNQQHTLQVHLGAADAEEAWMLGLLPFQGALADLQQRGEADVYSRAREAFREEAARAGWVDAASGELVVTGLDYRVLAARKPL